MNDLRMQEDIFTHVPESLVDIQMSIAENSHARRERRPFPARDIKLFLHDFASLSTLRAQAVLASEPNTPIPPRAKRGMGSRGSAPGQPMVWASTSLPEQ